MLMGYCLLVLGAEPAYEMERNLEEISRLIKREVRAARGACERVSSTRPIGL